jgi:hypothetical protein
MLVKCAGFVTRFHSGPGNDPCHLTAAVRFIVAARFVEGDDENGVAGERIRNVRTQPVIGRLQSAVVRVVVVIGNDQTEAGQCAGSEVGGELSEGNEIV